MTLGPASQGRPIALISHLSRAPVHLDLASALPRETQPDLIFLVSAASLSRVLMLAWFCRLGCTAKQASEKASTADGRLQLQPTARHQRSRSRRPRLQGRHRVPRRGGARQSAGTEMKVPGGAAHRRQER